MLAILKWTRQIPKIIPRVDTDAEVRAIPIGLSTARKKGKKVPRKNVIPGRLFLSFWNPGGFEKFT